MSTRCNLIIKSGNLQVYLYHHNDGYFEGVGHELKKIIKGFGLLMNNTFEESPAFIEYLLSTEGYEITYCIHGDIEYLYVIDLDKKTAKGYELGFNPNDWRDCDEAIKNAKREVDIMSL